MKSTFVARTRETNRLLTSFLPRSWSPPSTIRAMDSTISAAPVSTSRAESSDHEGRRPRAQWLRQLLGIPLLAIRWTVVVVVTLVWLIVVPVADLFRGRRHENSN